MRVPSSSDPVDLQKEPGFCPECGSASRVGRSLCLSCMLSAGMGTNGHNGNSPDETSAKAETLDDLLGELDVCDADWRIGNYQILEEIGRGGMGVIYRARQRHSRRIVALKRILSYHADSQETLARFRREAQAAASLDHPNILPIYEVSECDDGLPFFSMKFAGGGSLLEAAPALRGEPRRAVALVAKVVRAVQHAHAQGILHRDLETICAKCLEREPGARYRSAGALAEDLERWLEGRHIVARPVSPAARACRWTRRNPVVAGMAALLMVLGSTVGVMIWNGEMATPPAASGIAVLPFESLSADKENAFFADGVYDGVSTKLAKVANLKVISHNSVAKYRGARNTQDIGRALNIAYVLEGSVRREAGRIHLNAQLIDTRTDAHVWAQEYDRDLSDVFTLQSEIAQRIADQLGTEVSAAEKAAIQEPPTTDLVAYDSYLRAKDLINGISWSTRAKEDLTQAVKLLDQAVRRDALLCLASGDLAGAHDRIYFLGFDHTDARLKLSETAIQSVRRLRPESGETHLALAQHFYWAYADYDRAQSELVIAGRTLPNESRIPLLSGYIDRRQSRWEKSLEEMKRALELDPRNFSILQQVSLTYEALRRYKGMAATLDGALAISPKDVPSRVRRAWVDLEWRADPKPMHATIDTILAEDPNAAPVLVNQWLDLALWERDPAVG